MTGRLDIRRRVADERGQSLVLALLVLTVLAIALGTVIFFTSSNQRNSAYEKAAQVSRSIAEAGVNNGISVLSNAAKTDGSKLLNDGSDAFHSPALLPTQASPATNTYPGGSVKWWGTFNPTEQSSTCATAHNNNLTCVGVWTLYGTSTVKNPTGAADIHRTVTAKMQAYRLQDSNTADVWNWVFSPYKSGLPLPQCDTSFTNSVVINVRVWVGGNLCANNTVVFNNSLYVGGSLSLGNPQASVGSSSSKVDEVYVGAGCVYSNNPTYDPCVTDGTKVAGKTAKTNVFTNTLFTEVSGIPPTDTVFPNVAPPPLCWGLTDCPPSSSNPPAGGWYAVASPGPNHPCVGGTTSPTGNALPPVSDTNSSFDTSVPGVFNLTPDAYSYTCKTGGGELSWNRTTRVLTVQGAIFIDGSATASTSGNQPVVYTGWGNCTPGGTCDGQCNTTGSCQAVLFLSGTFSMTGEHLCAVANAQNNDCDTSSWDPNKKILIIATHGSGGQLPAGQGSSVTTNKSSFQGGLYAKWAIVTGQGGWVQGPLVSGTQTITVGQSTTLSFPQLTISPFAINQPPSFLLCNSSMPCQPFAYSG